MKMFTTENLNQQVKLTNYIHIIDLGTCNLRKYTYVSLAHGIRLLLCNKNELKKYITTNILRY